MKKVEVKRGTVGRVTVWCNSSDVVGIYNGGKVKRLPSKCYKRNMDFKLKREHEEETYGGEIVVCKVKGHQDKEKSMRNYALRHSEM